VPQIPGSAISLFHFDNNLNDALSAATVTNSGVTLSTVQSKFGGHSAYFNGTSATGSYLNITLPSSNVYTIAFGFID